MLHENELLQDQMAQTERDTVDVISYLKKEDIRKDDQVNTSGFISVYIFSPAFMMFIFYFLYLMSAYQIPGLRNADVYPLGITLFCL